MQNKIVPHPAAAHPDSEPTFETWLEYGALVAYDADHPPRDIADLDPFSFLNAERAREMVVLEHPQERVQVEVVRAQPGPGARILDVHSGRLFLGSSEALLEPATAGGIVVAVAPGRWKVGFDNELSPDTFVVSLSRVGDIQRIAPTLPPPALHLEAPLELEWSAEKVTLRLIGPDDARPALRLEFGRDGEVLNISNALPLWYRDGAWVYDLWLIGPREGATEVRVLGRIAS